MIRSCVTKLLLAVCLTAITSPRSLRACSACGCTLDADWVAIGGSRTPGLLVGTRVEYMEQGRLRSGSSPVDRASLDFPNEQEIQRDTLTRTLWLDLDDSLTDNWAISVHLPAIERTHSTIAEGDTGLSSSRASGLGDLRADVRYESGSLWEGFAVQAGLVLPTGRTNQDFDGGPQAGSPLDRGLQLGTGTAQVAATVSAYRRIGHEVSAFGQAEYVAPMTENGGFRPARSVTLSAGLRRLTTGRFTPQLQVNARWTGRETGANADTPNSGGFQLQASPGVTFAPDARSVYFAFVQIPLYELVNGLQLTPRWSLTAGVRFQL